MENKLEVLLQLGVKVGNWNIDPVHPKENTALCRCGAILQYQRANSKTIVRVLCPVCEEVITVWRKE